MTRAGVLYRGNQQAARSPRKTGVNLDFGGGVSSARDGGCLHSETRANNVRHVSFAALRHLWLVGTAIVAAFGCGPRSAANMSASEKTAIADSLKRLVVSAYEPPPKLGFLARLLCSLINSSFVL
jgi:hypothetical protein